MRTHRTGMLLALLLAFALVIGSLPMLTANAAFNFEKDPNATEEPTATPKPTTTVDPMLASNPNLMIPGGSGSGESATVMGDANAGTQSSGSTTSTYTGKFVEGQKNYGKTNTKGVNVRASASGTSAVVERIGVTGTVFEVIRETKNVKGEDWYVIALGGIKEGFIRQDLVDIVDENEYASARYSVVARPKTAARKSSGGGGGGGSSGGGGGGGGSKATPTPGPIITADPGATGGPAIATATPASTDPPPANPNLNPTTIVWTSPGASQYHKSGTCNGQSYGQGMAAEAAQNNGKTACGRCF